jgi:hypothetical protein
MHFELLEGEQSKQLLTWQHAFCATFKVPDEHPVHFDRSADAHISHLSTEEEQQRLLSLLKNPLEHLVQTAAWPFTQSEQPWTDEEQQASLAIFKNPVLQPVHIEGAEAEHLLHPVTEETVQQANASLLNVLPTWQVVHFEGAAAEQSTQFGTKQHAVFKEFKTPNEHPVHFSRFVPSQSLQFVTWAVQQFFFKTFKNFPARQPVQVLASNSLHLLQSGTGTSQQFFSSTLKNLSGAFVKSHAVHLLVEEARQLLQFWTKQQAVLSRFKVPIEHFVQTAGSEEEQLLQFTVVDEQHVNPSSLRKYPEAHPVQTEGLSTLHLLQFGIVNLQQANLSTLRLKLEWQAEHSVALVAKQSMQFGTVVKQQAVLAILIKAGDTQLVQISSSLKSQSLHLSIVDLQQVFESLLKNPQRHPVQTAGASLTHLLQFPTCELQHASLSLLK